MQRIAHVQSWFKRRIIIVLLLAVLPPLILTFYWFYWSPNWTSLSPWNTAAPGLREFSGWESVSHRCLDSASLGIKSTELTTSLEKSRLCHPLHSNMSRVLKDSSVQG